MHVHHTQGYVPPKRTGIRQIITVRTRLETRYICNKGEISFFMSDYHQYIIINVHFKRMTGDVGVPSPSID